MVSRFAGEDMFKMPFHRIDLQWAIVETLLGHDSWLMKRIGRSGGKKVYEEAKERKLKKTKEN